jgi:hypothetical protein
VIIIARGKLVATDSVENLTSRLRGAESVAVEVMPRDGAPLSPEQVQQRLERVGGVNRVVARESRDGRLSFTVESQQGQHIRQVVQRLKADAAFGTRFDVYTFEGDGTNELPPVLSVCAPGRPQDANELIENPERVRKRYEESFAIVLDKVINELLRASTRPNSPIVESLRAAAQTSFGPFDPGQIPLRATLVSDMVQHTADLSHFKAEANFKQLSSANKWAGLRPQLKGADVYVLYLLRPTAVRAGTPIQNRGHQAFWEQLIEASGGRLMEFDSF